MTVSGRKSHACAGDLEAATAADAGADRTAHIQRLAFAATMAVAAIVFLAGLSQPGLYDPHETQYGEIAREMVVSGDYITPRLDYARFLNKPPLVAWMTAASYRVFGISETSTRLPSALASVLLVALVFGMASKLYGPWAGPVAGLIYASTAGAFLFGRMLMPEMIYAAFTAQAFYGFVSAPEEPGRERRLWLLSAYAAVGLATMTKGLLGLVAPCLALAILVIVRRDPRLLLRIELPWGLAVLAAVVLPWHVAAALQNPEFLHYYIVNEHVNRYLNEREPKDYWNFPRWVLLVFFVAWAFPWSVFMPSAIGGAIRRQWRALRDRAGQEAQGERIVVAWVVGMVAFYMGSKATQEYYSLPLLAPIAVLLGGWWTRVIAGKTGEGRIAVPVTLVAMAGAASCFGYCIDDMLLSYPEFQGGAEELSEVHWTFGLLGGGSAGALLLWFLAKRREAFALLCFCSLATFVFLHSGLRDYEGERTSRDLGAAIRARGGTDPTVVMQTPAEYEFVAGPVFHTGSKVWVLKRPEIPPPSFPFRPDEDIVLAMAGFHELWGSGRRVFLITDPYGNHGDLDALAPPPRHEIGRFGRRLLLSNKP